MQQHVVFDTEAGVVLGPFGPCSARTALVMAALAVPPVVGWEECESLLAQVETRPMVVGHLGTTTVAVLGRFHVIELDSDDTMTDDKEGEA